MVVLTKEQTQEENSNDRVVILDDKKFRHWIRNLQMALSGHFSVTMWTATPPQLYKISNLMK